MKRLAILLIISLTSTTMAFDWGSLNPFSSLPTEKDAREIIENSPILMQKGIKVRSFNKTKDVHKTSIGKEIYSIHFNAEIECTKNIDHKCYKGVRDNFNSAITYIKKNGKWVLMSSDERIWLIRAETTCLKMNDLKKRLDMFNLDNGSYPETEEGFAALVRNPSIDKYPNYRVKPYLKKIPKDYWKTPFEYIRINDEVDIISFGGGYISFIQHCKK